MRCAIFGTQIPNLFSNGYIIYQNTMPNINSSSSNLFPNMRIGFVNNIISSVSFPVKELLKKKYENANVIAGYY